MKITSISEHHLISLSTAESLLMMRLLQAAMLHDAVRQEISQGGETQQFLGDLLGALRRQVGGYAADRRPLQQNNCAGH